MVVLKKHFTYMSCHANGVEDLLTLLVIQYAAIARVAIPICAARASRNGVDDMNQANLEQLRREINARCSPDGWIKIEARLLLQLLDELAKAVQPTVNDYEHGDSVDFTLRPTDWD